MILRWGFKRNIQYALKRESLTHLTLYTCSSRVLSPLHTKYGDAAGRQLCCMYGSFPPWGSWQGTCLVRSLLSGWSFPWNPWLAYIHYLGHDWHLRLLMNKQDSVCGLYVHIYPRYQTRSSSLNTMHVWRPILWMASSCLWPIWNTPSLQVGLSYLGCGCFLGRCQCTKLFHT